MKFKSAKIVNFSHPLTSEQIKEVEEKESIKIEEVINIPVQFDIESDFLPQFEKMIKNVENLESEFFKVVYVNPPSLGTISFMLGVEIKKYFYNPKILRWKQDRGGIFPVWKLAEVIEIK
ncbi:MAG: hypothetical protein KatS3mg002_1075 [Candidatus Woesearchaeota archaeon]|nr:MAG: hypothetical protein KatS3mg002_1075 [Candidatus Woesearchaeota archaeon]